jgi:hypothetical protein
MLSGHNSCPRFAQELNVEVEEQRGVVGETARAFVVRIADLAGAPGKSG